MFFVESELQKQLEHKRGRRWYSFGYPPRVEWSDIPMDDKFVQKFYRLN